MTRREKVRLEDEKLAWVMKAKAAEFKKAGAEIYKEV